MLARIACKELHLTFDQFYNRALKGIAGYPVIYKVDGRLFVDDEELHHLRVVSKIIDDCYVPVTHVSKKIFGDAYALMRYLDKGSRIFTVRSFFGKKYIRKDLFEKFYSQTCGNKKLVTFSTLRKFFIGIPENKIHLILSETGIIDKTVFELRISGKTRRFYRFSDVKEWCIRMKIDRFPVF